MESLSVPRKFVQEAKELGNVLRITGENFTYGLQILAIDNTKVVEVSGLDPYQKLELKKELHGKDFAILMHNCKAGDLSDFAAVSPKGDHVLVWNNSRGRTQQVIVLNDEDYLVPKKRTPSATNENNASFHLQQEISSQGQVSEEGQRSIQEAIQETLEDLVNTSKFHDIDSERSPEDWRQSVTLQFVNYSKSIQAVKIDETKGNYFHDAFFTIHIDIYATETNKFIKFKLTDAVGMRSTVAVDKNSCRGFFNHSASIYIFPGHGDNPRYSQLPLGWCRPHMEPRTTNSKTTYTCTTGWSIGGSMKAQGTVIGGITAGITASYNQSKQASCTIPEFKVHNISDGSMTGWHFYYTAMEGEKWHNLFDKKKPVSDLARGTITFNAECIYEGPSNYNNRNMEWSITFEPTFCLIYKEITKKDQILHPKKFSTTMKVDMMVVNHKRLTPRQQFYTSLPRQLHHTHIRPSHQRPTPHLPPNYPPHQRPDYPPHQSSDIYPPHLRILSTNYIYSDW